MSFLNNMGSHQFHQRPSSLLTNVGTFRFLANAWVATCALFAVNIGNILCGAFRVFNVSDT